MSFKLSSTAVIFESAGSSILVADSFTYTQLRPGYDSAQNIIDIEDDLIDQILNEICEDIFNKTFLNW